LKKINLIYKTFSHKKALSLFIDFFEFTNEYNYNLLNINQLNEIEFFNCDLMILSLGGKDINKVLQIKNLLNKRVLTASIFAGIITEYQIEAFITRLNCDFVFLSSLKEKKIYSKVSKAFGYVDNSKITGVNWIENNFDKKDKNIQSIIKKDDDIVFIEQIYIPTSLNDRIYLLRKLINISKNLNKKLFIKLRNEYINDIFSLKNIAIKNNLDKNIVFLEEEISIILKKYDNFISISSSVAIEIIIKNKKIFLLDDFGYKNTFLGHFAESGLIKNSKNISSFEKFYINEKWLKNNISQISFEDMNSIFLSIFSFGKFKNKNSKKISFLTFLLLICYFPNIFIANPIKFYKKYKMSIKILHFLKK
jgi:hypothetical protein